MNEAHRNCGGLLAHRVRNELRCRRSENEEQAIGALATIIKRKTLRSNLVGLLLLILSALRFSYTPNTMGYPKGSPRLCCYKDTKLSNGAVDRN